jgi:uncharacterized protein YbaP (TraB family)
LFQEKIVTHRLLSSIAAFALASALVPSSAFAQTAPAPAPTPAPAAPAPAAAPLPDADPALWVVRDADTTVYLFGTFHMLDGRPWFNDEVKTAFDASNELVLELLLPENPAELQALMQPIVIRYAIDTQGRTISSRLTPAQNEALRAALAPAGVAPAMLDSFEPWFMTLTLVQLAAQQMGLNPTHGPEAVLRRAAAERGLTETPLETIESQIQIFDNLTEEQQLEGLRDALDDREELSRSLAPMLDAWSRGDPERLAAIMNEDLADDPGLYAAIFTNRNTRWAEWIRERMARPGTVFLAVGGGHLAGPGSVQDALQAHGIRSERAPHVEAN